MTDWNYTANALIPDGENLPPNVRRYAAILAYDGTGYSGFQRQKHSLTIQHELETALSNVADTPITLLPSGRTDRGVHACHQVIHFDSKVIRSGVNWVNGANSHLPNTISLNWANEISQYFHARFSATSRTYRYLIARTNTRPGILSNAVTWVRHPLDTAAMSEACRHLIGERDYSGFRGSGCQSISSFRNVTKALIYDTGELIVFEITANAFLLHMVRNIVGALLEIGRGKRKPEWISELLIGRDRRKCAATSSASGLYLVDVSYPISFGLPRQKHGPFFLADDIGFAESNTYCEFSGGRSDY